MKRKLTLCKGLKPLAFIKAWGKGVRLSDVTRGMQKNIAKRYGVPLEEVKQACYK